MVLKDGAKPPLKCGEEDNTKKKCRNVFLFILLLQDQVSWTVRRGGEGVGGEVNSKLPGVRLRFKVTEL